MIDTLYVKPSMLLISDKRKITEYYIEFNKKTYKINSVRFIPFIKSLYTDEYWMKILKGYSLPLNGKTTKSKRAMMKDFIGAVLVNYVLILFDELQHGNIVDIGFRKEFLRLSFEPKDLLMNIKGKSAKLVIHNIKIEFRNSFKKKMKYFYYGRMNKIIWFLQIRKQLKHYNATIIHNSKSNLSSS